MASQTFFMKLMIPAEEIEPDRYTLICFMQGFGPGGLSGARRKNSRQIHGISIGIGVRAGQIVNGCGFLASGQSPIIISRKLFLVGPGWSWSSRGLVVV